MRIYLLLLSLIFSLNSRATVFLEAQYDELSGYDLIDQLIEDNKLPEAKSLINSEELLLLAKNELSAKLNLKLRNFKKVIELTEGQLLRQESHNLFLKALYEQNEFSKFIENWSPNNKNFELLYLYVNCLLKLQRYHELNDFLELQISQGLLSPMEILSLSEGLLTQGSKIEKLKIINLLLSFYSNSEDVLLRLSRAVFELDQTVTLSEIFRRLVRINSNHAYAAFEILRVNGRTAEALALIQKISSKDLKLKAQITILLEQQKYSELLGLERQYLNSRISQDEDLNYSFMYAHARLKNMHQMLRYLERLKRPSLVQKAHKMRTLIDTCLENKGSCRI